MSVFGWSALCALCACAAVAEEAEVLPPTAGCGISVSDEDSLEEPLTSLLQLDFFVGRSLDAVPSDAAPQPQTALTDVARQLQNPVATGAFACLGLLVLVGAILVNSCGSGTSDDGHETFVGSVARDSWVVSWFVMAFWCVAMVGSVFGSYRLLGADNALAALRTPFRAIGAKLPNAEVLIEAGVSGDLGKVAGLGGALALYQQFMCFGSWRLGFVALVAVLVAETISLCVVLSLSAARPLAKDTPMVIMSFCLSASVRSQMLMLSRFQNELAEQPDGPALGRVTPALSSMLGTSGCTAFSQAVNQAVTSVAAALVPALALESVGLGSALCSLFTLGVGLTLSPAFIAALPSAFSDAGSSAGAAKGEPPGASVAEPAPDSNDAEGSRSMLQEVKESVQQLGGGAAFAAYVASHPVKTFQAYLAKMFHEKLAHFVKDHQTAALGLVAATSAGAGTGLAQLSSSLGSWLPAKQAAHLLFSLAELSAAADVAEAVEQDSIALRLPVAIVGMVLVVVIGNGIAYGSLLSPLRTLFGVGATLLFSLGFAGHTRHPGLDADTVWLSFFILAGISLASEAPLYARSRELRSKGLPDAEATHEALCDTSPQMVASGLATAAAFVGLLLCDSPGLRALGLITAVGSLYDAVFSRCLLAPAAMNLLGQYNWWPSTLGPRDSRSSPNSSGATRSSSGGGDPGPTTSAGSSRAASRTSPGGEEALGPTMSAGSARAASQTSPGGEEELGPTMSGGSARGALRTSASGENLVATTSTGSGCRSMRDAHAEMGSAKQSQLQNVLDRQRVEVDVFSQEVRLTRQIQFELRHHGVMPSAVFHDEADAREILGDVAEVLGIFRTASLDVEGHTATPDDRLDDWSFELARNRAQKVATTLISLGVDSGRLRSVGRPGRHGTGRSEVVMRITDV